MRAWLARCFSLALRKPLCFCDRRRGFAGERETGTLRLLDILPVDRRVVWVGKVSFALVTTLALALLLLAMAALSTDRWKPQGSALGHARPLSFGMFVLVALGWGLFWSAILNNALTAAVMAICCTGVSLSFLLAGWITAFLDLLQLPVFGTLLVFLTTLIASIRDFCPGRAMETFHSSSDRPS